MRRRACAERRRGFGLNVVKLLMVNILMYACVRRAVYACAADLASRMRSRFVDPP